ncbi:M81 family metallopeptidase [Rhizobium sp. 16-449-1b]|uniref:M81 family metallopeptidase n=1 Tax=Rhizobium sp. 16-449-1b TaxID=2819989 RepID=UPI001ADB8BA4|nr:M81 family metallopeptidase [Rhizobium sp. 16-449-1b]MBO9195158.1 M81 family metallopeptidase [Rhizobium sp. 16-449-1b]
MNVPTKRLRIAVGRLYHESNRLNPQPATIDQFEIQRDSAVFECAGSTLGGIIKHLQGASADILPLISVSGPPSGLIEHRFYEDIRNELLERIDKAQPDAIVLDLHGAAATTQIADVEGDLLAHLREHVGPKVPIGVGLDLHAHLTDPMLENTDICIACKENPHADVVECGERAAELTLQVLQGHLQPVVVSARVPMILPGAGETASGPLGAIHAKARSLAAAGTGIVDISIYNVFRYADDYDIGQVVTVMTDGTVSLATGLSEDLARAFWQSREQFTDDLLEIDDAFETVRSQPSARPYVMADMGDRILAGAPGDSTILLAAVLERFDDLIGALTITDPASVVRAQEAGIGATITLDVGGQITPGFSPRSITGRVSHLSDGNYRLAGPFHGGEASSLGPAAILLVDERIYVLLTSKPAFSHDPAVFTSQGIDLKSLDFVVVKSGYHFTMNFEGLATPMLVSTPGVGYYRKGIFPYHKSRFWPEHEVDGSTVRTKIFGGRSPGQGFRAALPL